MEGTVSREYAKKLSSGWRESCRNIRRNLGLVYVGLFMAMPILCWAWRMAPVPPLWVQIILVVGAVLVWIGFLGASNEAKPLIPDVHED